YKLYEIQRPVTVGDNETKQVEFVSGTNIPAHTFLSTMVAILSTAIPVRSPTNIMGKRASPMYRIGWNSRPVKRII
ncbi:MAG: hypothetical protein H0X30_07495, partial [Anaerolineae bacterium]|nr:hypothetical protein [Anaerolineae bacterium]